MSRFFEYSAVVCQNVSVIRRFHLSDVLLVPCPSDKWCPNVMPMPVYTPMYDRSELSARKDAHAQLYVQAQV